MFLRREANARKSLFLQGTFEYWIILSNTEDNLSLRLNLTRPLESTLLSNDRNTRPLDIIIIG